MERASGRDEVAPLADELSRIAIAPTRLEIYVSLSVPTRNSVQNSAFVTEEISPCMLLIEKFLNWVYHVPSVDEIVKKIQ